MKKNIPLYIIILLLGMFSMQPQGLCSGLPVRVGILQFNIQDFQPGKVNDTLDIRSILALYLYSSEDLNISFVRDETGSAQQSYQTTRNGSFDFIVYGNYSIYENEIFIEAGIEEQKTGLYYLVDPVTIKLDDPNKYFTSLAAKIKEKIYSVSTLVEKSIKKIALVTRADKSVKSQYNLVYLLSKWTDQLLTTDQFRKIPFEQAISFSFNNDLSDAAIMDSLKLDALIILSFRSVSKDLILNISFHSKGVEQPVLLPELKKSYFKDIQFGKVVMYWLNNLLQNSTTANGLINTESFNLDTADYQGLTNQGALYFLEKQYFVSNYFFNKVLELYPDSCDLHYYAGGSFDFSENYDLAILEYTKAIDCNPSSVEYHYILANLYYSISDDTNAIKEYETVLKMDSSYNSIDSYLGSAYFNIRNYEEAIKHYKSAIRKNSSADTSDYIYIGMSYWNLKNYDSALQYFENGKVLFKNDPKFSSNISMVLNEQGVVLYGKKDYSGALEKFKGAKKEYSYDIIDDNIRITFILLGELDSASVYLDRIVKERPQRKSNIYYDQASKIRLVFLDRGSTYYLSPAIGAEINKYAKIHLSLWPEDVFGYWIIGNTFAFLKQQDSSLIYLEKGYNVNKDNTNVMLDYMESLLLNKEYQKVINLVNENFKKSKNWDISSSYITTLGLFYQISAQVALGQTDLAENTKQLESDFKKGVKIKNWDYSSYHDWIEELKGQPGYAELVKMVDMMEINTEMQ